MGVFRASARAQEETDLVMEQENWLDDLAVELAAISLFDMIKSYDDRNRCIIKAMWLALKCGFAAGVRIDWQEHEWPVAFIELPQGQVSWHLPRHGQAWDGHTNDEKNARIQAFITAYGATEPA